MSVEIPTIETKSVEKDSQESEVKLEEVAELEKPIKKIIEKIKDRIEGREYGLIIGDDASGRIPTRILGGFIQEVSKETKKFVPNIIFIPGKLEAEGGFLNRLLNFKNKPAKEQREELDEYLLSKGATKERRVLIVTDTLRSGYSLKTLADLLRKAGYVCDIATIGIEPPLIGRGIKENLIGIDIFSGEYYDKNRKENERTPLIYRPEASNLTGVYKKPGGKASKTLKSSVLPEGVYPEDMNPESIHTRSSRQEIQESINQSREDASVVIQHLINWYESQKEENHE